VDGDLKLSLKDAIEISVREPEGFNHLKMAFNENILENAGLEQLRFYGIYNKIIEKVVGSTQEYYMLN
jgi:hypothetical protein